MGLRQRKWAKGVFDRLKRELGGRCVDCGCDNLDELEFDHLVPRTWVARRTEYSWRASKLRAEVARGEIALRCGPCNNKKGMPEPPSPGEEPF